MSATPITIVRGAHRSRFTTIDNDLLQNKAGLSCQARAILFDLLSRPPDWRVMIDQLAKTHKIGRDQVYKALGELREAGYARLETPRNKETGHVEGKRWVITEEPNRFPGFQEVGDATDFLKSPKIGEHRKSDFQDDIYKGKREEQKKDSLTKPAAPRSGARERGESLSEEGGTTKPIATDDGFASFEAAWTAWTQNDTPHGARSAWRRLTPGEREEAARHAAAFIAGQANLRHRTWASTYLAKRLWQYQVSQSGPATAANRSGSATGADRSAIAGAKTRAIQRPDGSWWLPPDSPQMQRWHDYERNRSADRRARPGCVRPSEWPPGQATTPLPARISHGAAA